MSTVISDAFLRYFIFFHATMAPPSKRSAAPASISVAHSTVSNPSHVSSELNSSSPTNENASESNNRGFKRQARELSLVCILLEIPEEVLMQILSLQAHKDRLSVAITCSDILKKVEVFCQRTLGELKKRADETWEARIQTSIQTAIPPELLPRRPSFECISDVSVHFG